MFRVNKLSSFAFRFQMFFLVLFKIQCHLFYYIFNFYDNHANALLFDELHCYAGKMVLFHSDETILSKNNSITKEPGAIILLQIIEKINSWVLGMPGKKYMNQDCRDLAN